MYLYIYSIIIAILYVYIYRIIIALLCMYIYIYMHMFVDYIIYIIYVCLFAHVPKPFAARYAAPQSSADHSIEILSQAGNVEPPRGSSFEAREMSTAHLFTCWENAMINGI